MKNTTEKYIVDFNQSSYNSELSNLKEAVSDYNDYHRILGEISISLNSIESFNNLEEITEALKHMTGFVNVKLAASAMGIENEYNSLLEMNSRQLIDKKKVALKKGIYELKKEVLEDLKKKHTIYVPEDKMKDFDMVTSFIKKFNQLSFEQRTSLLKNNSGEWFLNKHRFIN